MKTVTMCNYYYYYLLATCTTLYTLPSTFYFYPHTLLFYLVLVLQVAGSATCATTYNVCHTLPAAPPPLFILMLDDLVFLEEGQHRRDVHLSRLLVHTFVPTILGSRVISGHTLNRQKSALLSPQTNSNQEWPTTSLR